MQMKEVAPAAAPQEEEPAEEAPRAGGDLTAVAEAGAVADPSEVADPAQVMVAEVSEELPSLIHEPSSWILGSDLTRRDSMTDLGTDPATPAGETPGGERVSIADTPPTQRLSTVLKVWNRCQSHI